MKPGLTPLIGGLMVFLALGSLAGCRASPLSSFQSPPDVKVGDVISLAPQQVGESSTFPKVRHALVTIQIDGAPVSIDSDCLVRLFGPDNSPQPSHEFECRQFLDSAQTSGCPNPLQREFQDEMPPGSGLWCNDSFPLYRASRAEIELSSGRVAVATSVGIERVDGQIGLVRIEAY